MKIIPGLKRRHYVARLSIFLITVALIAGMAGCPPPSENLEIRTWYDLDAVRDNSGGHHILMNDLDSTTPGYEALASPTANEGKGWHPIHVFTGSFDGQGYEIRDLFTNRPDELNVALFGNVGVGGVVQDVGVVNADVTGNWSVGGLVGANLGTLSNSYFTGSVTGDLGVGGLVASNYESIVSNSYYNYDEVLINGENIITIGALFGEDFDQWLANDKFLDVSDRLSEEDGYYVVNNVTDFQELLAFGQNGSLKFRLKNDLDLGDEPNFYIPYLAGEFDGNDHNISDLSFNFCFVSHVGLFGYLAPGGKVTQLGVENVNITGASSVGGLVGANWKGTVSDSYSSGSVNGSVTRSDIEYEAYVGGLVGVNWDGTVSNSYATVSVNGNDGVGGLAGVNKGTVSNAYACGNVTGNSFVGGLVGGSGGTGIVRNSYSSANVTGEHFVGGLVGSSAYGGSVSDSYSTSNVTGNWAVGGLVGDNCRGTVSKSYSTGSVSGNEDVGGLVGYNPYGTVRTSFWDIETSGQSYSWGGTGKTTAEMQDIATFSGAGWNIIEVDNPSMRNPSYIWNIVDNVTYPFLSWQL